MKHIWSLALLGMFGAVHAQFTPPSQLNQLSWMYGEWEGTMNWTAPGMPKSMAIRRNVTLDGQFLRMTSVMTYTEVTMTETTFCGWDKAASQYLSHSFTNISASPRIERGKFEDGQFVFISEPWNGVAGKPVSRVTIKQTANGTWSEVLEIQNGDKWVVQGKGELKRKRD